MIVTLPKLGPAALYVSLIGLAGCGSGDKPADMATQGHNQIVELAKRTQGDFSKLTPAEQKQLNSASFNHGRNYLMNTYKQIQSGQLK